MMIDLPERAVLRVSGEEAHNWLASLVTCDIASLTPGNGRWGALLTPQGKILFDFLVTSTGDALYLETDRQQISGFIKRLSLYRLRAKVMIDDLSSSWFVQVSTLAAGKPDNGAVFFYDPRHPELGTRILASGQAQEKPDAIASYHTHRIELGIPEAGQDFGYGEVFPHEVLMDMLNGIDFRKGCYIGQEVVSRMQHRGTVRTRFMQVKGTAPLPERGSNIYAGEKNIGTMGSSSGTTGLAMLRIDRLEEALAEGKTPTVGDVFLEVSKPAWWRAAGATSSS